MENEEEDSYSNSKIWPTAFAFACVCSVLLVFGLRNFDDPFLKQDRNYIELNNALYKSQLHNTTTLIIHVKKTFQFSKG